jgi:transcriptional regulator with PAS, ATPase and Fis domain
MTLLSQSPSMIRLQDQIIAAANSPSPVLITGETGVGKNVLARVVHNIRSRDKADIHINCSAIPEHLIESELFGHEKGAFTGADCLKKGVFELANNSSLVLDEICEMPVRLQARLLTVLEEKKLRRLAGSMYVNLNVKVIATTNVDINKAIEEKRFRKDLYYRLSTVHIHIPPLRERTDDIPFLVDYFVREFNNQQLSVDEEQIGMLQEYHWPGNIRELRNVIERASLLYRGGPFQPARHMATPAMDTGADTASVPVGPETLQPLAVIEKEVVRQRLKRFQGNKSATARSLGISLNTLKRKLRSHEPV